MEKEYKLSIFSKIFYGALTGGLLIFLIIIFTVDLSNPNIGYLISALLVIISSCIFLNLFKSKVIVTDTGIARQRIFYNRTLNFDDIKGVRIESKIIIIEPKDNAIKKLRITNYIHLKDSEELVNWLKESFVDLDNEDFEAERAILLDDSTIGYTIQEREAKLSKMRGIAIAYSICGGIFPLLFIFLHNSEAIFYVGTFYPLLGLVIIKFSGGLIKFATNPKRSAYSGILIGFFLPVIVLLLDAITSFEILYFKYDIKPALIVSSALFLLLIAFARNKSNHSVKGEVFLMIIVSIIFGFGTITLANCLFDKSEPTKFTTTVSDAYTTSGKGTHYHLKFAPWIKGQFDQNVDVSYSDYQKTPVESPVFIYQKKGLFNIPWFDYSLNPTPPAPAD